MPEFSKLDYASFQQAVYPYCSDLSGIREYVREKVGLLEEMTKDFFDKYILLAAGLDETDVGVHLEGDVRKSGGVSESMLSRYRNGKEMKPGIVKAYLKKGAEERTKAHFEKYLLPTIIRNGEIGILYNVWQIIKNDLSIPQAYKDDFEALYAVETLAEYLAHVFVFSITRSESERIREIIDIEKNGFTAPHETVKLIRNVQIRDDIAPLLERCKEIARMLKDDSLEEDKKTNLRNEASVIWHETHKYINQDELSKVDQAAYEAIEFASYTLEYCDIIYMQNKKDLFDRVYRLDEKYWPSE